MNGIQELKDWIEKQDKKLAAWEIMEKINEIIGERNADQE